MQQPLMFVNMFGLMGGMQINVAFQPCLRRFLSPMGLFAITCVVPPMVAVFSILHVLKIIHVSDGVYIAVQGVFFVLGGCVWMLGYSLSLPLLKDDEAKVEATRLLNLMTQLGILVGIGISMLVMTLIQSVEHHGNSTRTGGSGSFGSSDEGQLLYISGVV